MIGQQSEPMPTTLFLAALALAANGGEPTTLQVTVGLVRVSAHRPGSDKPWDRTQPKPQRDSCSVIDGVSSIASLAGLIPGIGTAAAAGAATAGKVVSSLCEQQRKGRVGGADAAAATDPDLFVRVVGTGGSAFRSFTAKDTTSHVFNFRVDVPEASIPPAGLEFQVQNDSGAGDDDAQETIGLVRVKRKQLMDAVVGDGLLTLADVVGGLDRLEVKVAPALSASRNFKGTLDVAKISGAFDGEISAGDLVEVLARGEYRVGGTLTTARGLAPSSMNFSDEPFRSGRHGAPLALVGSGGHFAGTLVAPCSHFVTRTSGRLVVGINDRGRRGDSGDLTFEGSIRPATADEWQARKPSSKCATSEEVPLGAGEDAKEPTALVEAAKDLLASRGAVIASSIQRITHPTGRSPVLDTWNVTLEGETLAVTIDVRWSGGLTRHDYLTRVLWEFDKLRHIQAKVILDTAAIAVRPTNAAQLDRYFRTLVPQG